MFRKKQNKEAAARFYGLPLNLLVVRISDKVKKEADAEASAFYGAGDEARTRYLHLGKVALYRMSYTRGTRNIIAQSFVLSTLFYKNQPPFFPKKQGLILLHCGPPVGSGCVGSAS